MMAPTLSIGILGLGAMGEAVTSLLLEKGFRPVVWNRTRGAVCNLTAQGALPADHPADLALQSDITLVLLSDHAVIDAVVFGERGWVSGVAEKACDNRALVNMATVAPRHNRLLCQRLRQHGVRFLEAPVLGSVVPARQGRLKAITAGDRSLHQESEPLFRVLTREVLDLGEEVGRASAYKLVNNLMLGILAAGLAEGIHFAQALGFSSSLLLDTLQAGPLGSGFLAAKRPLLEQQSYPPSFSLGNMDKDLGYALSLAEDLGLSLPLGKGAKTLYGRALAQGLAAQDMMAIADFYQSQSPGA